MAGSTGLEPATSGLTGRRSNQLNYDPAFGWDPRRLSFRKLGAQRWALLDSNQCPPACEAPSEVPNLPEDKKLRNRGTALETRRGGVEPEQCAAEPKFKPSGMSR